MHAVDALIWWMAALAADCVLEAPVDAPFEVGAPDRLESVRLVPLLRLGPTNGEATLATAQVFHDHGITVGFSIRPEEVDATTTPWIERLVALGQVPVVRLRDTEIGVDLVKDPARLRRKLKPLTELTGNLRAVEVPLGDENREALLNRVGLRAVFETNGASTATPRKQLRFEGQTTSGVVLPAGPYGGGPCGSSSVIEGLRPPGADRVTQALYGARASGIGIVRLTLVSDADSAVVVKRWLEEVLLPAGVLLASPLEARDLAVKGLRTGATEDFDPRRTAGGRLIRVDEVREVALAVGKMDEIPRLLPKDLLPTEALLAFVLVAAGQTEGQVVRLPAIQGPAQLSPQLDEPVRIDRAAAIELAQALLKRLPDRVPSALPVGDQLLNAPALFSLYASIVAGDDPPVARPMAVREPNAPGLGWGDASTP